MIVVEGASKRYPCSTFKKKKGQTIVTVKYPTENTDYLCSRHISRRFGYDHIPYMCYKWDIPPKEKNGKYRKISRDNMWLADWKRWDDHFKSFGPLKHPDPSSGTCAIFCVVERWNPEEIGVIGMDYVLDGHTDWFHDAKAELRAINSVVKIIDLRLSDRSG